MCNGAEDAADAVAATASASTAPDIKDDDNSDGSDGAVANTILLNSLFKRFKINKYNSRINVPILNMSIYTGLLHA